MDSLFADVSEFERVVDDSYPYEIFSLRSNDGTYRDRNFAQNYAWAAAAADSGKLACFIVYFYWRPNWLDTVNTHKALVTAAGGPHPRMITMIDVESGGNPDSDQSAALNATRASLTTWLGTAARVIGYANSGDFNAMWPTRPTDLRVIGAGYGGNPNLPGQLAHQYTNGQVGAAPPQLPDGAAPFGPCDMNSADGLSPTDFAAACGIGTEQEENVDLDQLILDQLGGPNTTAANFPGWPQLGGRTVVDALAAIGEHLGIPGFGPVATAAPAAGGAQ